jgi:hypothetical protein
MEKIRENARLPADLRGRRRMFGTLDAAQSRAI